MMETDDDSIYDAPIKQFMFQSHRIKEEALEASFELSQRGLMNGAKWLTEIVWALKEHKIENPVRITYKDISRSEFDIYQAAYSYFLNQEYERCAAYMKKAKSHLCIFLKYYAMYMNLEIKKIRDVTQSKLFCDLASDVDYANELARLGDMLKEEYIRNDMDGYQLYVYALVLKRLRLYSDAKDILIESIHKSPVNWNAWLELVPLVSYGETVESLALPDHWLQYFFYARFLQDIQHNVQALKIYEELVNNGFSSSHYIHTQMAVCLFNIKDSDRALNAFKKLRESDPYSLDGMDVFSMLLHNCHVNSIYNNASKDLTSLACDAISINKHKVETCCVLGNHYSVRSESSKAVVQYKRAVRLNPYYSVGWTLLGHEYLIMKNTASASMSYRKAINIDSRDFRALFGLGQTYETASLLSFALYYYKAALSVKKDSGDIMSALGDIYRKLDQKEVAMKFYKRAKAHNTSDMVVTAYLARWCVKTGDTDTAVQLFTEMCEGSQKSVWKIKHPKEFLEAAMFLAAYYVNTRDKIKARRMVLLCCTIEEEAKQGQSSETEKLMNELAQLEKEPGKPRSIILTEWISHD